MRSYRRADFQIRPALCAVHSHDTDRIRTDLEVRPTGEFMHQAARKPRITLFT
jgi:hypothetical protein